MNKYWKVSLYCFFSLLFALSIVHVSFAGFPDTTNHKYSTAIDWVQADGIVSGYPDGYYRPDNVINRAEFTKIIVESVVGGNISGSNCFPDVGNQWFAKYICTAKREGIVGGNEDGTFTPEREVNYAESLKIVLEAYKIDFPRTRYEYWYSKYVEYALENALSFAGDKLPHSFVTRGEMAEMIYWMNRPSPDIELPIAPPNSQIVTCQVIDDCWNMGFKDQPYCNGTKLFHDNCVNGQCVTEPWPGIKDCADSGQLCRERYLPDGTHVGAECY